MSIAGHLEQTYTTEDEWLEARKTGIGGSDAPAVLGVSSWKAPFQLWSEKTGLADAEDLSDREWIEWGHRLEAPIVDALADRTGRVTWLSPHYTIARHCDHDWMICTPDARQGDDIRGPGLVQIKTTSAFFAKDWEEEPPLAYQVQLQHELAVTGLEWGTLAVLIGGQKLRWFDVGRNQAFIDTMIATEREFWRRVTEQDPPPVDGSPATTQALKTLYPTDYGETIALPQDAVDWDVRLVEVKESLKDLEAEKRLLENQLKDALGVASAGMLPDGTAYTHKKQSAHHEAKGAYTSTFRVLRRRKAK